MLGRFLHVATTRPLKVVSSALGIGAVGMIVTNPGQQYSVLTDVMTGIADLQAGNQSGAQAAFGNIPTHVVQGVSSPEFFTAAAGAVITGIISKKFRI